MIPDESKYGPYIRVGSEWEQIVSPFDFLRLDRHVVAQVGFSPRNEWALELAQDFAARKQPFLVTVQRLHHLRMLCTMLKRAGLHVRTCHGSQDDVKRSKSLEALRNGEIDGIVAIYNTVSEGTDIPNLVHLIKLDGITEEQVLTQQLGRVQRRCAGKKAGYMHIPVDLQAPSLASHAMAMRGYYTSQGIKAREIVV
jgi:excinuclease UvrABC helicase subunit UvrB